VEQKGVAPCTRQNGSCPVTTQTVSSLGTLPPVVALASGYVPAQNSGCAQYGCKDALQHGTLYPALFLPFRNMYQVCDLPDTPLVQLMALDFAMIELGLYLDTHPTDKDALEMRFEYQALFQKMKAEYEKQFGPILSRDADHSEYYEWICDPWPWNKRKGG